MPSFRRHAAAFLIALLAAPAAAQDEEVSDMLDRIEVTGSRLSYEDLLATPAISIRRPGDYLLQTIVLSNDSRDESVRRRELRETIGKLVAASGERIHVLHGDEYRVRLTAAAHDPEPVTGKREDTSEVTLALREKLASAAAADVQSERLRAFAREAAMVGRTEVDLSGSTAVGMNRPERFRYELIAAIAKDTHEVTAALTLDCQVTLEGLNSRIKWERVSAGELLLYIPYTMTVEDCRPRAAP